MISQATIKIQCKKLLLQKCLKKFPKKCKNKEPTNRHCRHLRGYYCFHICLQPDIFIFSSPNVSLEDDEHLLHISKYRYTQVQSHKPRLWSHFIGRESRKWDREDKSYISINTYTQHITLITWHLQYIIIKDLSWRKNIFQWECFFVVFCNGGIIVIVSAFVLFIIRNIIVLLVGWWLGLMLLRFWLIVLALLWKKKKKICFWETDKLKQQRENSKFKT